MTMRRLITPLFSLTFTIQSFTMLSNFSPKSNGLLSFFVNNLIVFSGFLLLLHVGSLYTSDRAHFFCMPPSCVLNFLTARATPIIYTLAGRRSCYILPSSFFLDFWVLKYQPCLWQPAWFHLLIVSPRAESLAGQ